jgi:hypothetical protein
LHRMLMNSPDHRANLLSASYKDIGIGLETGQFTSGGQTFRSLVVTEDFGKTSARTTNATATESFVFNHAKESPLTTQTFTGQRDEHQNLAVHADADWGLFT